MVYGGYERDLFSVLYNELVLLIMNKNKVDTRTSDAYWSTAISKMRNITNRFNNEQLAIDMTVESLSWLEYSCNNGIPVVFDANNIYNGIERYIFSDVYNLLLKFRGYVGEKNDYYWNTLEQDKGALKYKYNNNQLCCGLINSLERQLRREAGMLV